MLAGLLVAGTSLPAFGLNFPDGKLAVHIWSVPGVVRRNGLATTFLCTNVGLLPVNIGVEVLDHAGVSQNDISVTPGPGACNGAVLNVPPNGTISIANSGTTQLHEDCIISMPSLLNGSARIYGTAKSVACSAIVIDRDSVVEDPATGIPTGSSPAAVSLKVIKTTKQKGE